MIVNMAKIYTDTLTDEQIEIIFNFKNDGTLSRGITSIQCVGINCEPLEPLVFGHLQISLINGVLEDLALQESVTLSYPSSVLYRCEHGYTLLVRNYFK